MATAYKDRFANVMKTLSEQTLKHRLWLSDRWSDTEAGKDSEIRMLEYACGPGVISMVCCRSQIGNLFNVKIYTGQWPCPVFRSSFP